MQFRTILGTGVVTMAVVAIAAPATAQPIPIGSLNACTQRVAEDMVVQTRDIEFVSAGPIEATTGVRTLVMRNRVTGQTSQCRVNTIDSKVLSVTTSPQTRPPQVTPPTAPIPPAAANACIQRTAEEMVVQARNIEVTGAGPIDAESGVRTLFMRDRATGKTADCRVNTFTSTVLSVTVTSPRPPQPAPPGAFDRPISPNDPSVRRCEAVVSNQIRNSFRGVQAVNFLPDPRQYPITNTIKGIRGSGQFSQGGSTFHRFNYNCNVNMRNGQVVGVNYDLIR